MRHGRVQCAERRDYYFASRLAGPSAGPMLGAQGGGPLLDFPFFWNLIFVLENY